MGAPSPPTPLPPADEGSRCLNGLRVLVTRPEHQAESLCRLIEQHGGQVPQTFEELEAHTLQNGEPSTRSGRQEMLENLINEFI